MVLGRELRLQEQAPRTEDDRAAAVLPQVASQYLHPTKIELAKFIAQDAEKKWGHTGRVHFNVGGAQAIEDSLKVVRNASGGKSLMFAFEGGYHGRTLGASSITSSYRYRRRYGHFGDRAQFIPFPYPFRRPKGMTAEEYSDSIVKEFARKFENEYHAIWDPKTNQCEYAAFYVEPIQGTGGYVVPPPNFFKGLKKVLDDHGVLLVVDEIQMGFWRTGTLWSVENFGVKPDVLVFAKALTNGLNALSGLWAREELINPTLFPPGSTHSTFASNPLGTALGLEVMKMTHEMDFGRQVRESGAYFLEGLRDLQKRHREIGDVDGLAWRCAPRSAPRTASRPTRRCWTRWSTSAGRRPGLPGRQARPGAGRGRLLQERDHVRAVAHDQPFGNRRGHGPARPADLAGQRA